uniref:THAP-type domain-containing protein n=1 Tax=Ixodes ricinus TaxID=34613 RepID=A0A147BDZ2_IXORI
MCLWCLFLSVLKLLSVYATLSAASGIVSCVIWPRSNATVLYLWLIVSSQLVRLGGAKRALLEGPKMVTYCSVPQCNTYHGEQGVSFYYYPTDKKLRKEWLIKLKMGKPNTRSSRVCSKHFTESDFVYPLGHTVFGWKRRWLAPGTVPSKCLPDCSADGKRARSRPRLKPARAGIRDASASEPEEILPTLIGESMHCNDTEPEETLPTSMDESIRSNDCGRVFVAPLYLERRRDNAAAVKKEPEEVLPTLVDESAWFEDEWQYASFQSA